MTPQRARPKPYRSPWLIVRAEPVDWFRLLADLQGFGYTNADVARAINVAPSKLAEWKQGIEPKFENGRALVMLHASVCEIRHTESTGSP